MNITTPLVAFRDRAHCEREYHRLRSLLITVEAWLDGVRNERDRTRFEQRWNTLQDEAAELRVLIVRALAEANVPATPAKKLTASDYGITPGEANVF